MCVVCVFGVRKSKKHFKGCGGRECVCVIIISCKKFKVPTKRFFYKNTKYLALFLTYIYLMYDTYKLYFLKMQLGF